MRRACFSVTCLVLEIRLRPVRRDDSSRVLIGAAGRSCSDWPERVQAFGVRERAAIDNTRAGASGSLQSGYYKLIDDSCMIH